MKIRFICASALSALLLSLGSCSSDNTFDRAPEDATEHTLTFNLRLPAGEKVSYARDIHDPEEFAINSLTLYEYEVIEGEDGAKTTSLTRVMEYPNGTGKNTIDLKQDENGSCKFSIIVPAANDGKTFTYKFVANRDAKNKTLGSDFTETLYTRYNTFAATDMDTINGGTHIRQGGMAMSGTAVKDGNEELVMSKGLSCDVKLTRIASRIDIKHQIPNLRITSVTYKNASNGYYIFPHDEIPTADEATSFEMPINREVTLPKLYLNDEDNPDTKVELKKAFYIYERKNEEANCASVYIKYEVKANGKDEPYYGEIEVPFQSTKDQSYVDIIRNHLYTIVLGNGNDPISGKVTAKLVVDDWNPVDVDEPLTDDDQEVNND